MPLTITSGSDIGGREEQQDRYLSLSAENGSDHLLAVADGAGGHKGGALAAQTTIDLIESRASLLWSAGDLEAELETLCRDCNDAVTAIGDGDMACSTVVILVVKGDQLFWAHVGDSRFYHIRGAEVFFQTCDHSLVELQKQGHPGETIEAEAPSSNQLYMCLGAQADITPQVDSGIARSGDLLLLCSDGFWGQLDMESTVKTIAQEPLSDSDLRDWIERAKSEKGPQSDNITVITARFDQGRSGSKRAGNIVCRMAGKIRGIFGR